METLSGKKRGKRQNVHEITYIPANKGEVGFN